MDADQCLILTTSFNTLLGGAHYHAFCMLLTPRLINW